MAILVSGAVESPSQDRIRSFEDYCRVSLPADFKDFLSYGNGGVPNKNIIRADGKEYVVERFLPLTNNAQKSKVGQYDMSVVQTQLDDRLGDDPAEVGCKIVPFAALFSGDFLCFDFRKRKNSPEIVVWDHSRSEELSPYTIPVAHSFSDLSEHLSEE